jgi:NADH-quinone oxidoreductase subunit A
MARRVMEIFYLTIMVIAGIGFVLGGFFFSRLVAPYYPDKTKSAPYECGEFAHGPAWRRFPVGYYLFALLFLIFDVEVIFIFPWAVTLKSIGWLALIEGFVFIGILLFGLVFAWRKGYLTWD